MLKLPRIQTCLHYNECKPRFLFAQVEKGGKKKKEKLSKMEGRDQDKYFLNFLWNGNKSEI